MTSQRQLKILITGDYDRAEFRQVLGTSGATANGKFQDHDIEFSDWPTTAMSASDADKYFDLIVVAQARRNQFPQTAIDELARQFPLAQRVLLVGSWCEGETRSGQPLVGIHRAYLRSWAIESSRLIDEILETGSSKLSRPTTETTADRLIETESTVESCGPLNVAVHGVSPEFFESVQEFCVARGWQAERLDRVSKCDLAIVECYDSIEEAMELAESNAIVKHSPFVAICGFPREQDRDRLAELTQRTHLLGKPFENEFLETAIKQLASNGKLNVVSDVA